MTSNRSSYIEISLKINDCSVTFGSSSQQPAGQPEDLPSICTQPFSWPGPPGGHQASEINSSKFEMTILNMLHTLQVKYYGRDPASGKMRLSRKVITVAKVNAS